MTVSCPDCRSAFRVDPAKVPATGVRARCSVCGGIIVVSGGSGAVGTPAHTPVRSVPAASDLATREHRSGSPRAVAPDSTAATPAAVSSETRGRLTPPFTPSFETPTPAYPPAERRPTPAARPAAPTPVAPTPVRAPAPAVARPAAPTPMASPAAPAPVRTPTPLGTRAVAAPPASTGEAVGTPKRSINPFLNADPGQRARRLARALVSDLVAYHPRKRDEGIAQGTLRQLFRDEIKKSYEEYVDQVGREIAESSPHFQEALNEILAGGQRVF